MGRRAIYTTSEDKRQARNLRRQQNSQTERAKALRREQNRTSYLQRKPLPVFPSRYVPHAVGDISPATHTPTFREFVAGRDSLSFDTYTVTTEDLSGMTGAPPYPVRVEMEKNWDAISAAVHGFAVASYLQTINKLTRDIREESTGRIFTRLLSRYHSLEASADTLLTFIQSASASPNPSNLLTNVLAFQNFLWDAQLVRYALDDLKTLRESGAPGLIIVLTERRWTISRHD